MLPKLVIEVALGVRKFLDGNTSVSGWLSTLRVKNWPILRSSAIMTDSLICLSAIFFK